MNRPDFEKYTDELVPAIIQDADTLKVLMLGFMNEEAFQKTMLEGRVTFFSRSKNRLWTKGEESGHFLNVIDIMSDCDKDTLLIKVRPEGPVCHTGSDTCWAESNTHGGLAFLSELAAIIKNRRSADTEESYVAKLFAKGINKIAQKVGEEAVETVIEAKDNNPELFLNEAADLLFHYMILLEAKDYSLNDVVMILQERHRR